MEHACSVCGYRYERENGYFVGSIYVNYGAAAVLALAAGLLAQFGFGLGLGETFLLTVPVAVLFPLWFFRYARSLWMLFDLSLDPPQPAELGRSEASGGRREAP